MKSHNEVEITCNNDKDFWKFQINHNITDMIVDQDDYIHIKGVPINETDKLEKISRPNQLGVFISAYSRRILLHMVKKIDPTLQRLVVYYSDTDSLNITAKDAEILEAGLYSPDNSKLGYLSNDLKDNGLIAEATFKEIKSYMCRYVDTNFIPGSTELKNSIQTKMRFKGIPKGSLKPELYTQQYSDSKNKIPHVVTTSSMRKRNLNVTEKELERGHEFFSVTCLQLSRTINPNTWNESNYDPLTQEWFPEGYMCDLPPKLNGPASQASPVQGLNYEKTSCDVEARESMKNYMSDQNVFHLSICEVY